MHQSVPVQLARAGELRGNFRLQDSSVGSRMDLSARRLLLDDRRLPRTPYGRRSPSFSLRHVARLLQPGGCCCFGIDDWPRDLPAPSSRVEDTSEGRELIETVPDRSTMTTTHCVTLMRPDGRRATYTLMRRHYSQAELTSSFSCAPDFT